MSFFLCWFEILRNPHHNISPTLFFYTKRDHIAPNCNSMNDYHYKSLLVSEINYHFKVSKYSAEISKNATLNG